MEWYASFRQGGGSTTYNGDAVIVDMSQFMQFFFNLGVSLRGSGAEKVRGAWSMPTTEDIYISGQVTSRLGQRHTQLHRDGGWSCSHCEESLC